MITTRVTLPLCWLPFRAPAHSLCGAALSGSRELEPEAAFPGVPEPQEMA